jgi:hypothetical protein
MENKKPGADAAAGLRGVAAEEEKKETQSVNANHTRLRRPAYWTEVHLIFCFRM